MPIAMDTRLVVLRTVYNGGMRYVRPDFEAGKYLYGDPISNIAEQSTRSVA